MLEIATIIDLSGSLAILGMLAVAYGGLHRLIPNKRAFDPIMGLLFGLVAFVQMHSPVEPYPGLIVDMRCVPVVLAGAFLGGRGLLPCLLIAVLARFWIGGVGMTSGIAALLTAGAVGLLWQGLTSGNRHGWKAIGALGCLTSIHLIGAVLLPFDLAIWFLREAAPVLVLLNAVSVPAVAALLEREQRQIRREEQLAKTASFANGDGLMGREALTWALGQAAETGSLRRGPSVVAVRIRFKGALARFWGNDADRVAMRAFNDRLTTVLPEGGLVGWATDDLVLMAIPRVGAEAARQLLTQIRRDVSSEPISLPGMAPFRLVLDVDVKHYPALPEIDTIVRDFSPVGMPTFDRSTAPKAQVRRLPEKLSRASRRTASRDGGDLFETFDKLRDARYGAL